MRKLPWAALGLLAAVAMTNVVFVGCGSDDTAPIGETGDGGDEGAIVDPDTGTNPGLDSGADSFISTIDGSRADAAVCTATGAACTKSTECCTTNCDTATGKCANPSTLCKLPGTTCALGNECCTFSCIGGTCSSKLCVADNQACGSNAECCGGTCAPDGLGGGKCTPLNGGGPATSGNPCVNNSDCASKFCNAGICSGSSFCGQIGDVCSSAAECCGGLCTKASGAALGVCGTVSASGVGGCSPAGTVCVAAVPPAVCGGACCGRSCAPFGPTGVDVCQPESGCRVTGSICQADSDCCGSATLPDGTLTKVTCSKAAGSAYGRCDNGNKCSPAGAICRLATVSCNATDRCCAGTVQQHPLVCKQDALGIPRCGVTADYDCTASGPPAAGTVCASSADCCGNPCIPNAAGTGFVCGTPGQCVKSGGVCTANADCCPGLPCAIAPGSTKGICGGSTLPDGGVAPPPDGGVDSGIGTDSGADAAPVCAFYGQSCTMNTDCCNTASGVQCLGSVGAMSCRFP